MVPDQDKRSEDDSVKDTSQPINFPALNLNGENDSSPSGVASSVDNSLELDIEIENQRRLKALDINDCSITSSRESNLAISESAVTALSEMVDDTHMLIDSPAISPKSTLDDVRSWRTVAHNGFVTKDITPPRRISKPEITSRIDSRSSSSVNSVDGDFDKSAMGKTVTPSNDKYNYEIESNIDNDLEDEGNNSRGNNGEKQNDESRDRTPIHLGGMKQFDDFNSEPSSDDYESEGSIVMSDDNNQGKGRAKIRCPENRRNVRTVQRGKPNSITTAKSNEIEMIIDIVDNTITEFLYASFVFIHQSMGFTLSLSLNSMNFKYALNYRGDLEDENSFEKEIHHFKKEFKTRMRNQVWAFLFCVLVFLFLEILSLPKRAYQIIQLDLVNEQITIRSSLRKAKSRTNQLHKEIACLQHKREKIEIDLSKERKAFKRDEQIRKKLEQVHDFLSDIEILRESVMAENALWSEDENLDGFEGLLTNAAFKCCDVSYSVSAFDDTDRAPSSNGEGTLGTLHQFNALLEACEHIIRQSSDGDIPPL
ncbi:3512_t:CDS:2 [Acaulospora colombiana]|uniref:3512_t:CDS:1 n=1 Tax=Acaulospora colombiana TaxID=27376 RepID=A0ACA9LWW6_9GLOM|nr:3512_t:CDS:2 [Acaulospora colombiana]